MGSIERVVFGDREIILVGTAHVSQESVDDVRNMIENENPDSICVEIDAGRLETLKDKNRWSKLDVFKIIKQGQGFMLLASLVLSSFQKRMGLETGVNPGDEMKAAVELAESKNIPYYLCDRDIQITLKRAWAKTSFWGKNKLLAALLGSAFSNEKISEEELKKLKEQDALNSMMEELADYLPDVKTVLIDERDTYLATKIWQSPGKKTVAVVGAGHMPGIISCIKSFADERHMPELKELEKIPPKSKLTSFLPWLIPAAVIGLIVAGFFIKGPAHAFNMFILWFAVNGVLAAIGSLVAGAHPLTILAGLVSAPFTSLTPVVGVGMVTGLVEASLRKPRVEDLERINDDITSIKGFFKNRVTKILMVFFLSSVGSSIGTFIGIPWLSGLLAG
ncbi:TraB/GumN family protein [Spirochaetia bacterium 38H-sp]|uniref:TraB/GumN family protein n=1 Tax=Rarispira pelagica TaxID=3141764 RepID=A0ABU9U9I2_9SPIR